jgi:trk system potassium uptake protein TrkA
MSKPYWKKAKNKSFAVLGLGRFGMSVVETLSRFDVNILAVDADEGRIREAAKLATHAAQADMSNELALKALELGGFDVVIIAMGQDTEATLIAAMVAREQGAKYIIAKAAGVRQKKILEKIGVDEMILPEREMGVRTARRLVGANIMEILGESDLFEIEEMKPLPSWIGKSLREAEVRRTSGLIVLAIFRNGKLNITVSPESVIAKDDIFVVLKEKHK